MRCKPMWIAVVCGAVLWLAVPAAAQEGAAPPAAHAPAPSAGEKPSQSLEQRVEELERLVEALQRELARRDTAERAEEAAERAVETAGEAGEAAALAAREAARVAEEAARAVEQAVSGRAAAPAPPPGDAWEVGYREGGGGFFMRSADGDLSFRQLGYVQFVGALFHDDFERGDAPGDFSIRRARVDWLADFYDRYQVFVEFDGGPGSVPGSSDFALVEAKVTADVTRDGRLQLVGGKFVSPFSSENRLSSRSQDTVERYIALNSMFLLPALDVQYGAMLRGHLLDRDLEVMAGVFNGNGRANDNLSDDNGDKELQLKLNYRPHGGPLKLGLGFDLTNEESQSLQLRGLTFTPWVAVPVRGTRRGVTADFAWSRGPLSLRGEGLWMDYRDADAELAGGFVQGARFLRGDATDGLQALLRLETAGLDHPLLAGSTGDRLDAVTLGLNWFWGGNFRVQLDAVGERYDGLSNLPAGASRVEGDGWKPYLLSELQVKF